MDINDFDILSEIEKLNALSCHGSLLMARLENGCLVNLASLEDFYVEAYFNPEANKIVKFRTFKSLDQLEPYLDKIKLNLK